MGCNADINRFPADACSDIYMWSCIHLPMISLRFDPAIGAKGMPKKELIDINYIYQCVIKIGEGSVIKTL